MKCSLDGISGTKLRTDAQLVSACRRGDESAWEEIVLRHQRLLYSIPRRAGLSTDQASDVLQDVFTTLFQKLDQLEKPEFLRAWLVTTTRHKTMHSLVRERRGRQRNIDDEDDPVYEVADRAALPDEKLIAMEQAERISTAFAALEERCFRLLTMLYLEEGERSYAEIAAELELPLGSVGPTRARCLEKLLKLIPDTKMDVFSGRSK